MRLENRQTPPSLNVVARPEPDLTPVLDKAADATGLHGAVGDSAHALLAGSRAARANRIVALAADLSVGDAAAVATAEARLLERAGRVAGRLQPLHADVWLKGSTPAIKGATRAVAAVGKAAPVLGVLSSAYDVGKAVNEKDQAKRGDAWTTAGLSVGGTGLGLWGMARGLKSGGAAALAAAAGIGVFQLVDTYVLKGKGTSWLTRTLQAPFKG